MTNIVLKEPLPVNEQEVTISIMRDEPNAIMYISDNTWITKINKCITKSPELFVIDKQEKNGVFIHFPKKLLTIRSGFVTISEEQKQACAERMQKYLQQKKSASKQEEIGEK